MATSALTQKQVDQLDKSLERFYFVLDVQAAAMRCFKSPAQLEPKDTFYLQGCEIQNSEHIVRNTEGHVDTFEVIIPEKKASLLIIPELGTNINELKAAIDFCSKLPLPKKSTVGSKIKKGVIEVLKSPWTATNFIIGSLEKLSSKTKDADSYICKDKKETSTVKSNIKEDQPSNIATGVLRGTGALVKSLFDAIIGIFVEPVKGGKKGGFTGAIKGVGKGVIGLVLKPVHGTLDFVTLTARGITNTPKTIYLKISSIFRKKVRKPKSTIAVTPYLENNGVKERIIVMGESDNDFEVSIDIDELRKQLLDGLLDESLENNSIAPNKITVTESTNHLVMKEIKTRQKKLKRAKKCRILKIKYEQKHFKEKLEKALSQLNKETDIDTLINDNQKFNVEILSGMAEIEHEGFPSPEVIISEGEAECVNEFNKEEDKNFNDVCNEFAVKCNVVTIGVDGEENKGEILEPETKLFPNSSMVSGKTSTIYGRSFMQSDGTMSYMEGRFRKNPKHRAPPSKGYC